MTSSFTTLSSIRSFSRFALVPSILAASLALGACQKDAAPTGGDAPDNTEAGTVTDATLNTDTAPDTANDTKLTAEQEMIKDLARYRWTLLDIDDKSGGPVITMLVDIKEQVTLLFNQNQGQNTLNYSVGCNTISAVYQLQGQTLTTEESMSTKMLCEDLNKAENRLNTLMQGSSQLSLTEGENPVLTQVTSNAITLTWEGKLTSQAKYNSKGETVFWAVNAKKVACADDSSEMCLQVKPITYDDQGIKVSEGEWSAFTGEIDGYQHDGMHDEVLRLQRYELDSNESTEGEEYAYVLDAVIESAVAE
ncbi:META domain-containing protein [uncultured Psychrobacter sp.]|uniref:META domain-containing protein n=1 Tax=uncultured Psychrobacter sp. TaxID=259303 RepID=UPI002604D6C8|nr:META domain-containing protein [uncultured Psychrobacter sp.]